MRFVAGRGAEAELLQAGNRRHRGLPAGALQRRAIGKQARKEPCCKQGKSTPCWANKKESGKTHSLKPALVMPLSRVLQELARGGLHNCYCALWNFYGDAAAVAHLVWLLFGYGDRFYGNKGILHCVKIIHI